jgi:hypothetical protein
MEIILPKTFVEKESIVSPLFFLAGPVRGGRNWQEQCCLEIEKTISNFSVVVPTRWQTQDKLFKYSVSGADNVFKRQTDWEYLYLSLTLEMSKSHKGCIIFWLPERDPKHLGEYGRDTRGELGRWGSRAISEGGHIVIGAEAAFPGVDVIQRNLELDLKMKTGQEFPIYQTLRETARRAVDWVIG